MMSTRNGSDTQNTTTQISDQFDTDISEESARKYANLDAKSEYIRSILGVIVAILFLIAIIDIIISFIPIDGFFLIVILVMFIGMIAVELLLKPLQSEKDSVGVTTDSLARYEFNQAIEQYNKKDYEGVMYTLTELRATRGSNINAITSHGKQLKRYIRKLEKRDKDNRNSMSRRISRLLQMLSSRNMNQENIHMM